MRTTPELLRAATGCTQEAADRFADPLTEACTAYGIDSPVRRAAFLAQLAHESGGLWYVLEIASGEAYEGRKSLGNTQPGDGVRYKGRGLIQCTGRANYIAVRDSLRTWRQDVPDFEAEPEMLEQPLWAALSAADWWARHGCNDLADAGEFVKLGRLINRGNANDTKPANHEPERLVRWGRAKAALGVPEWQGAEGGASVNTVPTQEATMPLPAIIGALLPTIIEAIPRLGKLFGSGSAVAERNVKAAELAVQIVQQATGATNAQEAAEKIKADPAAAATATQAIEARWFELAESGGGGIDGARKMNAALMAPGSPPFWMNPAFLISLILLTMPMMLLVDVFYIHPLAYVGESRTQIVTGVLMIVGMVGGYWIGTSMSSAKKDERSVA